MTTGLIITAASLSALGWMVWKVWQLVLIAADEPDYMGEPGHSDYDGDE